MFSRSMSECSSCRSTIICYSAEQRALGDGNIKDLKNNAEKTYTRNVAAGGPDAVDVEADSPRALGDAGALLQGVVDPVDAVTVHGQEEAAESNGMNQGVMEHGMRGSDMEMLY